MTEQDPTPAGSPALTAGDPGELATKMGIQILEFNDSTVVATMPVETNRQPFGLLHGGASAVLAETVGSFLGFRLAGPGRAAVGVELNCTHHRSARTGIVSAVCVPLHVGRTLGSFEIVISDADGRRICTARLTVAFIAAGPRG